MKKKYLLAMGISLFLIGISSNEINVKAQEVVQVSESIMPKADIIKWRYKDVDGHMYRRQYNYSESKWLGEWERC